MFFELDGKTYCVFFGYDGRVTSASLYVVENGSLKFTGIIGTAVRYYKDVHNERIGRREALADLLWQVEVPDDEGVIPEGLDKEKRAEIWAEYLKTHKK